MDENSSPLDLDEVHNTSMKIFGDVFESLIGAVFMDCRDIDQTWGILRRLIEPYMKVYANLETMQDHPRTMLLEEWNKYRYTKRLKITHESKVIQKAGSEDKITLTAKVVGWTRSQSHEILNQDYPKDHKDKVRSFYKILYKIVTKFVAQVQEKGNEKDYVDNPEAVRDGLRKIYNKQKTDEYKRS